MSLSLGLAAGRSYVEAGHRRDERERVEKRFGWEEAEAESRERLRAGAEDATQSGNELASATNRAGLDTLDGATDATRTGNELAAAQNRAGLETLPGEVDARRSGNQLEAAQNQAGLDTLPGETEVAQRQNELSSLTLEGSIAAQPNVNEAARLDAETGVTAATGRNARQGLDNQTLFNRSTVERMVSELTVEQAPAQIADMRRKQVISDAEAGSMAIYYLGQMIDQGDPARVVQYMNSMGAADPNDKMESNVASVSFVTDDASGERVFVAADASGKEVMRLSKAQMDAINRTVKPPQTDTVSPGQTVIQTDANGNVNPVYTAPDRANQLPAEARLVEYYVSKGMSEAQALSRASTLKNMSPDNAAFQLYKDRVAMSPNMTAEQRAAAMDGVRKEVAMIFNLEELPELSEPPAGADGAAAGASSSGTNWADWVE